MFEANVDDRIGQPSAIAPPNMPMQCLAPGTNGKLLFWKHNPEKNTWDPPQELVGSIIGQPSVIATPSDSLQCFAQATNGRLHHWWYHLGNWNGPEDLEWATGTEDRYWNLRYSIAKWASEFVCENMTPTKNPGECHLPNGGGVVGDSILFSGLLY